MIWWSFLVLGKIIRGRVVEGNLMGRLHTTLGPAAKSIESRRGRCGSLESVETPRFTG